MYTVVIKQRPLSIEYCLFPSECIFINYYTLSHKIIPIVTHGLLVTEMSWVDNENSHSNLFKSFEVRSTLLKCVDAMKTSTGLLKDAAKSLQESTFEQFLNSQASFSSYF